MGFGARSFNPGDVLPPTVPVVTATRTGPQEITVTWGASSDASGVARYYIREYGVPGSEVEVIGPNRSRSYSGLTPNTAYRYEVRAQDIYGNISLYGASALVSTLPINVAPVWSVIPALALSYNTGGTRDVKPYVVDANGDPITISLVNPPAGYTISNGVINATASVAAATLTLSASDGLLTSTTTMSVTVASAPTGEVVYKVYDNFDNATMNSAYWQTSLAGTGPTLTFPTDRFVSSPRSFKSFVPTTAYRAELSSLISTNAQGVYYNDEQWYGLSVYIPSNWVTNSNRDIIWQWHHKDWIAGTKVTPSMSPATCLQIRGNGFQVVRRWNTLDATVVGETTYNAGIQQEIYPTDAQAVGTPPTGWELTKGAWHHFVVQAKWHWTSSGIFRLWKNGTLIYDRGAHPNCGYELDTLPLFNKLGNYRVANNTPGSELARELWFDNYRMIVDNGSFAAVDPSAYVDYPGVAVSEFNDYPVPASMDISSPLAEPIHVTDARIKTAAGSSADWTPLWFWDSDTVFVSTGPSGVGPRSGNRCAYFRLNRYEPNFSGYYNLPIGDDIDPDTGEYIAENERTEIRWMKPEQFVVPLSASTSQPSINVGRATQDTWLGFSIFVPATYKVTFAKVGTNPPEYTRARGGIITQIHHNPQSGDTESNPPIIISLSGSPDTAAAVPTWSTRASRNVTVPNLDGSTSDPTTTTRAVALGSWTDWVIQVRYDPWIGYARFWCRDANSAGQFVLHSEFIGGVGYAKTVNKPYWKIGPYFSLWNNATYPNNTYVDGTGVEFSQVELFYDSIRFYTGNLATTALGIEYVKPR